MDTSPTMACLLNVNANNTYDRKHLGFFMAVGKGAVSVGEL